MKDEWEIMSIDEGRQIDRSNAQPSNAESATVESLEAGSNATVDSCSQRLKQS
jgi:hypothetical protein